jgi:hypothetical protein
MKRLTVLVLVLSQLTALGGTAFAASTLNVYPGGTIQAAVDTAVNGDTIYVHEGTYNECVVINGKNLTLTAVGDVTIQQSQGFSCPGHGDLVQIYNGTVTFEGFTVSGGFAGIYARSFAADGDAPVNATIRNNTVKNYTKNGITANGDLVTVKVLNNTVLGRGQLPYGDWAQNGIQLGWGVSDGLVKGNTVKDHWYTGGYWVATNILLNDTGNSRAVDNTLVNGQVGLYVVGTGNMVSGNHVAGAKFGAYQGCWPPDPQCAYNYEYGSWGLILDGNNNKAGRNTIGPYDVGVEVWGENNKVINNTIVNTTMSYIDGGNRTRIHAMK